MEYKRNQWVADALKNADINRLKAFEARLEDEMRLPDCLDRNACKVLAAASKKKLCAMEDAIAGLTSAVPFDLALWHGNLYLLEKNKEHYFADGWERTVANILFLNNMGYLKLPDLVQNHSLKKIRCSLEWVKKELGKLPPIEGLGELCTKLENCVYFEASFLKRKKDSCLKETRALREITGVDRIDLSNVGCLSADYIRAVMEKGEAVHICLNLEHISFNAYDIEAEDKEKMSFTALLKSVGVDRIEFTQPKHLEKEEVAVALLRDALYDQELQWIVYELYKKFCRLDYLVEVFETNSHFCGKFKALLERYYQEEE